MSAEHSGAGPSGWLALARRPEIVRRSLRVAGVVGTILVAINYTDRALAGTLAPFDWVKMAITYAVPYCVATFAAVQTLRQADRASHS
jgi:hypothetical protein